VNEDQRGKYTISRALESTGKIFKLKESTQGREYEERRKKRLSGNQKPFSEGSGKEECGDKKILRGSGETGEMEGGERGKARFFLRSSEKKKGSK